MNSFHRPFLSGVSALIQTPSPSLQEREASELVAEKMRAAGFNAVRVDDVSDAMGTINGLNGYPVTIQVIDDKIAAAMKAAQKAQAEIKAQAEFDAEQKAPKKKRARRKKKVEETHAE